MFNSERPLQSSVCEFFVLNDLTLALDLTRETQVHGTVTGFDCHGGQRMGKLKGAERCRWGLISSRLREGSCAGSVLGSTPKANTYGRVKAQHWVEGHLELPAAGPMGAEMALQGRLQLGQRGQSCRPPYLDQSLRSGCHQARGMIPARCPSSIKCNSHRGPGLSCQPSTRPQLGEES